MILKTQHHGTLLTTSDTLATAESYQHDLPPGTAAPAQIGSIERSLIP